MARATAGRALGLAVVLALVPVASALPAAAKPAADADRDGLPTAWEVKHRLDPRKRSDATGDPDRDGLSNLREYRLHGLPRDEDTDDDGQDDGDERVGRTAVNRADSDRDGVRDGDEDADRDGVQNEDEDDAREVCAADDDDRDRDAVADEDENELRLKVGAVDSDADGIRDGHEDRDADGVQNEDEDDAGADACDGDRDGDGRDDEDEDDRFGVVTSYDEATGSLVVTTINGVVLALAVTEDSGIEVRSAPGLECDEPGAGEPNDPGDEPGDPGDPGDDPGEDTGDEPGDDQGDDHRNPSSGLAAGVVVLQLDATAGLVDALEVLRTTCD